ncbi:MAG: class I SAM-dependent methyltransferase [Inquilinaceae bacterium]
MDTMTLLPALDAQTTYDAAADHFDDPPLAFWDRHGRQAVDLIDLKPGDRVLDVGCGTGASAIPAARAVGPQGSVLGIDIAENMLVRARAKAKTAGLANIRFDRGDMAEPDCRPGTLDAIISVFSIFFVPDMPRVLAKLGCLLRPGGRLVVTAWQRDAFFPGAAAFATALREIRPDIPSAKRPWERLIDPERLRALLVQAGFTPPRIVPITDRQPLETPEDWWTIALGSGYRNQIEKLSAAEREAVRSRTTELLARDNVRAIETSVQHALAVRV